MRNLMFFSFTLFAIFLCSGTLLAQDVVVQSTGQSDAAPSLFSVKKPVASSSISITQGNAVIYLWGVKEPPEADAGLLVQGTKILQAVIGFSALSCEYRGKGATREEIFAQCDNVNKQDLGLYMVQEGYAVIDRTAVSGTLYEQSYVKAQLRAQDLGVGVWKPEENDRAISVAQKDTDGSILVYLNVAVLLVVLLSAFGVVFVMLRGFHRLAELQNRHSDMMFREQKMREKEQEVIGAMLDSELKANKSKIDAYIAVYEETLSELKNTQKPPRYQKLGDIIQKQPALSRGIFDKNSDKLHILGKNLASELVHFYARIKTNPDYENVEPDTDVNDVIRIVEEALDNAQRLNSLAENLVQELEEGDFGDLEEVAAPSVAAV